MVRKFFKWLGEDISGNVLVIAAAGIVVLVGGAGLGVDTVEWYLWKRQLQQAVDSGALAGGNALSQGSDWNKYANKELDRTSNTSYTVVRIVNPPQEGAYTGDAGAVEVIATTSRSLPFSSLFIDTPPTIRARAVATAVTDGEFCVYTLAPGGVGIKVAGTANMQLGCGVNSNSRGYASIDFEGSGALLGGTPISAAGGINYESTNINADADVEAYGVIQDDPIASQYSMDPIPSMGCDETNYRVKPSESFTLSAGTDGYYKLCNSVTVQGNLTLNSGVYIINGGSFKVNSGAKLYANGVTFILTGGAKLDFSGGAAVNMRAPNADDDPSFIAKEWYGMLIYQDPDDAFSSSTLAGNSASSFEGIIYTPKSDLTFTGSSTLDSKCLMLVSYRLTISGEGKIENNCEGITDKIDNGARFVRIVE